MHSSAWTVVIPGVTQTYVTYFIYEDNWDCTHQWALLAFRTGQLFIGHFVHVETLAPGH